MPFTEKQRRYFHAAAERGEKGMTSLAKEADVSAKHGNELEPVHMAEGGIVCPKCGAEIGLDGEMENESTAEFPEQEEKEAGRDLFIDAVRNRRKTS